MVKLASALPKENERNGIANRTRDLIRNYDSGAMIPVLMLVRTQEVIRNKDYETVPKIEVVHIEAVPDDQADEIRERIVQLHDARVGHKKQPLNFGDGTDPETPTDTPDVEGPLAIEAGDDVVDAEVIDDGPLSIEGPTTDTNPEEK
ncbi:hypothetical protein [Microbacterium imperiale]|uniref:Uncharacterized protein n=1 Tax=Microbacterium imperiale TaxID=33884 RepID=A0A9W6M255_9MICO|nr:hypothetical protein [Microbacterium imperiale]MBP2420023.1 hypothetical protein [Microbacterium imperiale]MDS0198114.1 hypothetical protein [Microbacterium imperiale]BFE40364.1 hypothetical protein GCM10017544_13200 [Microbacterium imperiale]GLJ78660.1 hypothetical protein GCM10017586_03420 [Microbacterium imperiale]